MKHAPKYFDVDLSDLSASEKEVVEILKKVGETVHLIWEKQVDPETGTINFYPAGLSKDEIAQAAKNDKKILDSYTVVKKIDGKLVAVSYADEYKEELTSIVADLRKAADVSEDKSVKSFLTGTADAFEAGDFEKALIVFLTSDTPKIEVMMGPIETYLDKLFGVKKAFQFNLRVLDSEETFQSKQDIDIAKSIGILTPDDSNAVPVEDVKVQIRIDRVLVFGGRQANTMTTGTNLPNEAELVNKYGTKIIIYKNALSEKFDLKLDWLLDYFDQSMYFNSEHAKQSMLRLIVLHEISEAIVKFPDSTERFQGEMDAIREVNAYLLGVKSAQYHVFQGLMTHEEYSRLLVAFLLQGIDKCARRDDDLSIMEYAKGFSLIFGYARENDALKFENNQFVIDIPRFNAVIDYLSNLVLRIFETGKEEDIKKVFKKYLDFSFCKEFPKPPVGK